MARPQGLMKFCKFKRLTCPAVLGEHTENFTEFDPLSNLLGRTQSHLKTTLHVLILGTELSNIPAPTSK